MARPTTIGQLNDNRLCVSFALFPWNSPSFLDSVRRFCFPFSLSSIFLSVVRRFSDRSRLTTLTPVPDKRARNDENGWRATVVVRNFAAKRRKRKWYVRANTEIVHGLLRCRVIHTAFEPLREKSRRRSDAQHRSRAWDHATIRPTTHVPWSEPTIHD